MEHYVKRPQLATLTWPDRDLMELIFGSDGEGDESSEESSDEGSGDEESSSESEGDEEADEGEEGEGEKDDKKDTNEALLKALRDERKLRKTAQKELKALRKTQPPKPETKKEGEEEADEKSVAALAEAEKKAQEAEQRNERLAAGLATQAVNARVTKFATEMGFRDTDDAIASVKRDDIDFDQDDDDPTKIEVDDETVKQALKDLLKKKPHYKKTAEELRRTGGNVGSGKTGGKDELSDETLRERYPILGRGRPPAKR